MAYIKKLMMHGFKSFATKTEVPFDRAINVIIGPNGSGKSNISDALCFVLGRLSIKSMRAARAANLIFQGSKGRKPSHEASVELIFDNSDKALPIDTNEVSLRRIVRRSGHGIYKIGNETKTRQEILELLAKAGIDPYGFNIVLQGEIQRFVKMRSDERREIIEEIAGISIYESRKQKSLREIEKTEQKLKDAGTVLRERTSYLKNLEEERKQALRFKELEKTVKNCKATILKKHVDEKTKSKLAVDKEIDKNEKGKKKIKDEISDINNEINDMDARINEINHHIQKTTGLEKDNLSEEITNLNAKIAASKARKENFERRLDEDRIREEELKTNLADEESELEKLKKESPKISKRQEKLNEKKKELEKVESEKEELYDYQIKLNSLRDRIIDKKSSLDKFKSESKSLFNKIESLSQNLKASSKEECMSEIIKLKSQSSNIQKEIDQILIGENEIGKLISISEVEIKKNERLIDSLPRSEICPLCQTKLDETHITEVINDAKNIISANKSKIKNLQFQIESEDKKKHEFEIEISNLQSKTNVKENELNLFTTINEKKSQMKKIIDNEKIIENEITDLEDKRKKIERKIKEKDSIEETYNKLFFEMQELSSRTDENLNTSILYKEREIESLKNVIRSIGKSRAEIEQELNGIELQLDSNTNELNEKQKSLVKLNKRFKELYDERTNLQEKIKEKNILLVNKQNVLLRFEEAVNNYKVDLARISAEQESLEYELKQFPEPKFLPGSIQILKEKLAKAENTLSTIGSVNLRALETYDAMKQEYEKVYEKVSQIEKERDDILKIIAEIDNKKKRTFMKTFKTINELFERNFSHLSAKGRAFMELENKDDIFNGGVTITIRVAKGKYFDVTSLSGGEQTLVALSLIFAIQEHKPYSFYILDEIDAALDKTNSELLSNLLKKYIKAGQYIIISHNDSIITNADTLYGVSMNNGISKILSLQLNESKPLEKDNPSTPENQTSLIDR